MEFTVPNEQANNISWKSSTGEQRWVKLPSDLNPDLVTAVGYMVIQSMDRLDSLILCQRVEYIGGTKSGIFWEPVLIQDMPTADMPKNLS